jgi:hypothetical protein
MKYQLLYPKLNTSPIAIKLGYLSDENWNYIINNYRKSGYFIDTPELLIGRSKAYSTCHTCNSSTAFFVIITDKRTYFNIVNYTHYKAGEEDFSLPIGNFNTEIYSCSQECTKIFLEKLQAFLVYYWSQKDNDSPF